MLEWSYQFQSTFYIAKQLYNQNMEACMSIFLILLLILVCYNCPIEFKLGFVDP